MESERVNAFVVQQRWEYHSEQIEVVDRLDACLNHAGEHFWELVSLIPNGNGWQAVYKRPRRVGSHHHHLHHEAEPAVPLRHPR